MKNTSLSAFGRQLVVITGPSGVGKDSVIEGVRSRRRIARVITTTSRPPRQNDRPYHYVTTTVFRRMVRAGRFAEWARVYGALYGTTHAALRKAAQGGGLVVLANDPQGARSIKRLYPGALTVFLRPPSRASLARRLRARGQDAPAVIRQRLRAAKQELRLAKRFDAVVVNRDGRLKETVRTVLRLIRSHRL